MLTERWVGRSKACSVRASSPNHGGVRQEYHHWLVETSFAGSSKRSIDIVRFDLRRLKLANIFLETWEQCRHIHNYTCTTLHTQTHIMLELWMMSPQTSGYVQLSRLSLREQLVSIKRQNLECLIMGWSKTSYDLANFKWTTVGPALSFSHLA